MKDYKDLDPKLLTLSQIKDIEDELKNKSMEEFGMNKNELIKSLVRFMKPDTAYNEFLRFLTVDRNANCALLLIKKENTYENMLDDNKDNQFSIKAVYSEINSEDIDFSRSILQKVLKKDQPILISNAVESTDFKNNPSIIGKIFLSVLAIPLKNSNKEIIGALYLDRRDIKKRSFVKEDIKAIQAIADILTPILIEQEKAQKAKLFSEIQNLGLFIGSSKIMHHLYNKIQDIAKVDMIVYIYGETGTGKELVAKALHRLSDRREKPFIAINCSAIPKELAESELFGHEKGSFTGATSQRKGKFELAENGVLFLDEIAELPIELQAKLLRVLQNKEIWKVGGIKAIPINVRVIVSTHKNLSEEVNKGLFREDLYHRLNVLKIEVPTLRDRVEDIPLLSYHFLKKLNKNINKKVTGFTADAMEKLQSYSFSGNVRELENIITKAFVSHKGEGQIIMEELFPDCKKSATKFISKKKYFLKKLSLQEWINNYEKEIVEQVLKENNWNISKTSKILKADRKLIYRIIERNKLKK